MQQNLKSLQRELRHFDTQGPLLHVVRIEGPLLPLSPQLDCIQTES